MNANPPATSDLLAIGDIARASGCHRDAVAYVLRKLSVEPLTRVAGIRVFHRMQIDAVLVELLRIQRARMPGDWPIEAEG